MDLTVVIRQLFFILLSMSTVGSILKQLHASWKFARTKYHRRNLTDDVKVLVKHFFSRQRTLSTSTKVRSILIIASYIIAVLAGDNVSPTYLEILRNWPCKSAHGLFWLQSTIWREWCYDQRKENTPITANIFGRRFGMSLYQFQTT